MKKKGEDWWKLIGDIKGYEKKIEVELSKGEDDMREKLNEEIKKIREEGKYEKIVKKYLDLDIYW